MRRPSDAPVTVTLACALLGAAVTLVLRLLDQDVGLSVAGGVAVGGGAAWLLLRW